jgi:tRNA(Arg) A34 adenosine deaminase TadA
MQLLQFLMEALRAQSQKGERCNDAIMLTDTDLKYLRRCAALAQQALAEGNPPFGSLLVGTDGNVLAEDHNRTSEGDPTLHPEITLARWAAAHLGPDARAAATVYTSGEHCPMCAAAHGWVGLGRLVYATSSEQLADWKAEWDIPPSNVHSLPIEQVVSGIQVDGPAPELANEIRELQRRYFHG